MRDPGQACVATVRPARAAPAPASCRRSRGRAARASAYPNPSLPVFGSDRPPVASTTRAREVLAVPAVSTHEPAVLATRRRRPARRRGARRRCAPHLAEQRVEHRARAVGVREQLAVLFLVQRHAELAEECRGRSAGNARRTLRTMRDEPPQKSRSVTMRLVTLQREPPLTRIFAPTRRAPSRQTTRAVPARARRQKIAVARPAAPPPTITRSAVSTVGSRNTAALERGTQDAIYWSRARPYTRGATCPQRFRLTSGATECEARRTRMKRVISIATAV